jgi:hypothetical protein
MHCLATSAAQPRSARTHALPRHFSSSAQVSSDTCTASRPHGELRPGQLGHMHCLATSAAQPRSARTDALTRPHGDRSTDSTSGRERNMALTPRHCSHGLANYTAQLIRKALERPPVFSEQSIDHSDPVHTHKYRTYALPRHLSSSAQVSSDTCTASPLQQLSPGQLGHMHCLATSWRAQTRSARTHALPRYLSSSAQVSSDRCIDPTSWRQKH